MRLLMILVLALASTSVVAAQGVHKCKKPSGAIYYSDKACSSKNSRDKPLFDRGADPAKAAPPPPQTPQRAPKR